jgi:hypothetical protein
VCRTEARKIVPSARHDALNRSEVKRDWPGIRPVASYMIPPRRAPCSFSNFMHLRRLRAQTEVDHGIPGEQIAVRVPEAGVAPAVGHPQAEGGCGAVEAVVSSQFD